MRECSCGKQINEKYEKCYDCHKKEEKTKKQEDKYTDLNKKIEMPMWTAIAIFFAGALIGAWIF